jgi:hypothetical protein
MALGGFSGRLVLVGLLLSLAACETRSISDSGYRETSWGRPANPFYKGELSSYDVLGLDPARGATDAEIQAALIVKRPISIRRATQSWSFSPAPCFPTLR